MDFSDFSDFTAATSEVQTKRNNGHHKKHSTFANIPFAGNLVCDIL